MGQRENLKAKNYTKNTELNKNESATYQNIGHSQSSAGKRMTALNPYIRKEKYFQTKNLSSYCNNL